jgi:hypothetical protein
LSLLSVGIGFTIGFFSGRKRVKLLIVRGENNELQQLTLFDGEDTIIVEPEDVDDEDDDEVIVGNDPSLITVVRNEDRGWDQDEEESRRSKDKPYILHVDEFIENESGYNQDTITYFAGDDIMCDSDDTPMYDYVELMGELRFGHGSRESHIVYIRNDKLGIEWEILLHDGKYHEEILGARLEAQAREDLKHAQAVLKFRRE